MMVFGHVVLGRMALGKKVYGIMVFGKGDGFMTLIKKAIKDMF
jgi:hypothetical protein